MKKFCCLPLIVLSLVACNLIKPTPPATPVLITATQAPAIEQPSPIPTRVTPGTPSPYYRIQIKISTSSDWTTLQIASGGAWQEVNVTSSSDQAKSAGVEGDAILLSQPLDRAQSGQSVDLVAEAFLTNLQAANPVQFEIDRGAIGSTRVDLFSYPSGAPFPVAVLTWDGNNPGGRNGQTYEVSAQPFLGSKPNDTIVIAQLNFWYYGPGKYGGFENDQGQRNTALTPLLGATYAAADPAVVHQQIEWAVQYGVDAFSIEWTTPRGVGCCGSMEDTLDDVFLKSSNINKVRWAIFYDFPLRLMQTPGLKVSTEPNINFDQPDVYNTFVSDFVHFAQKYFGNPQYLTIDGRPVIYIWATNSYRGNFAAAMQEARKKVADLGYDVFIVGDEVCYGCFNRLHAALFDGSSTFNMILPGFDSRTLPDMGVASSQVDKAFQLWTSQIVGLKVTGRNDTVNFEPGWAPQFDNRLFSPTNSTYIPALSKDQVTAMAQVARKYAQPVGSSGLKLIWINTWNDWAETTTIEPTANLGPKYPAGNYQFDMLDVVRDVFGSETYYTSPVR